MPKEGLNIYFTIKDDGSATLSSISDKTKALDKETQALAQSYAALKKANEPLIRQQAELEKRLDAAKRETKEAEKAFKKLGDAASDEAFTKAKEKQNELHTALAETKSMIQENERAYKSNLDTIRKGALSAGGFNDSVNIGLGLISGQVGDMISSSLGGALEFALTSGIGIPAASLATNALSDAISGAIAGSVFGPWGTLIGGAVGLGTGALSGYTEIIEAKDDGFKEYYAKLYETVNANTEEMISSGSAIAGSREQTFKAFAKRLGSDEAAEEYLDRVKTMAASTNYDYDEITGYSKLLLNSYDPDEVFGVLQSLSDATAGLDLSSSDVSVLISGLSRMRTTGKTTQEYLNYFSERGIDVYAALAGFADGDKSKVAELVSDGGIAGADAAKAILYYIDQTYGGLSKDLMSTYDALSANLEDIMSNLDAAAGEGYNEVRNEGLEAETAAYGGALGEALEEINRISGENKAYMENLSEQYKREALGALLLGEDAGSFSVEDQAELAAMREAYLAASEAYNSGSQEAGLSMERLKEDAEALAIAAYESSDQYQNYMDEQLEQIEAIRENTAGLAAATNAYLLSQELSKGTMATEAGQQEAAETALEIAGQIPNPMMSTNDWGADSLSTQLIADGMGAVIDWFGSVDWLTVLGDAAQRTMLGGYAYGLDRVPYDGFPAVLHEGERILTASQAQAQDNGSGGVQIIVTGNSFQGTGEDMADQIAELIAQRMEQAATAAAPR